MKTPPPFYTIHIGTINLVISHSSGSNAELIGKLAYKTVLNEKFNKNIVSRLPPHGIPVNQLGLGACHY